LFFDHLTDLLRDLAKNAIQSARFNLIGTSGGSNPDKR